jgi:hypothetical protein
MERDSFNGAEVGERSRQKKCPEEAGASFTSVMALTSFWAGCLVYWLNLQRHSSCGFLHK